LSLDVFREVAGISALFEFARLDDPAGLALPAFLSVELSMLLLTVLFLLDMSVLFVEVLVLVGLLSRLASTGFAVTEVAASVPMVVEVFDSALALVGVFDPTLAGLFLALAFLLVFVVLLTVGLSSSPVIESLYHAFVSRVLGDNNLFEC